MESGEPTEPSWTERSRRFWFDSKGRRLWKLELAGNDPHIVDTVTPNKVCEACGQSNCRFVCFVVGPNGRKAQVGDRCIMRAVPPDSPVRETIRGLTGQARRTAANAASAGRRTEAKRAIASECRALANDPRVAVVGTECHWVGHGQNHFWLAGCLAEYADRMDHGSRANSAHEQSMLAAGRALCQEQQTANS
jgi:hypothetical protein